MNRQKLNRIISLVLNAIKKEQGERREHLRACIRWLNKARNYLKSGRENMACLCADIAFDCLKDARAA
jgi:hypothetical protein